MSILKSELTGMAYPGKQPRIRNAQKVWECPGCGAIPPPCFRPTKKKTICVQCGDLRGLEYFASKREHARWHELKLLEKAGQIRNLRRQVRYTFPIIDLQPDQNGWIKLAPQDLKRDSGKPWTWTADFVYEEKIGHTGFMTPGYEPEFSDLWQEVVEDCKGMKTELYLIKKALMLACHGIEVRET